LEVGLPQAFADESPVKLKVETRYRKRMAKAGENDNGWVAIFVSFVIVVSVVSYCLVQLEHMRKDIIHEQVESLSREWKEKYSLMEEENERLQKKAKEYIAIKERDEQLQGETERERVEQQKLNKQIDQLTKYKQQMQRNIQLMSKTALLEKFGPGPHKVEIIVQFDPNFPKKEGVDETLDRIIIELAPVDEMPHVVYWFLEQVSRGLYDGCSFHRNAGHVVQGGPAPNFLSPPNPKLHKRFKDAGFYSILFQEYSPNFPHKKYTLGLAGRPGGPDFYVSTRDNSRLHGPGGQTSYEDPTEADSCFAKVILGFDVVDRMQLSPVKPGGYKAMVENVAIISMKILEST